PARKRSVGQSFSRPLHGTAPNPPRRREDSKNHDAYRHAAFNSLGSCAANSCNSSPESVKTATNSTNSTNFTKRITSWYTEKNLTRTSELHPNHSPKKDSNSRVKIA